ncbi:MAG: alpha/beta fold hydrolase [Deltaproteobacteria bacterium]|nr:alpha/beta fold hydrolase [Deltaproteobacteria bacterium]
MTNGASGMRLPAAIKILRRIRGFLNLAFDVVEEISNLAERTHDSVVERSARRIALIDPSKPSESVAEIVSGLHMAISGSVFKSIRGISDITHITANAVAEGAEAVVYQATDAAPDLVTPLNSTAAGTASWYVDHLQASINGFWGDHLRRRMNRLDLGMTLRHNGRELSATPQALAAAFPNPSNKVCLLVHGLGATEWLWSLSSEKHYGNPDVTLGTRLHDDLGMTPIYVRYNTGRHISENGRALAALLTEVFEAYPVPIEEIALIGFSMGGLVVRSAAHYAREQDAAWIAHLRHVACIASPHLGAPLEKGVNLLAGVLRNVPTVGAQVSAELLNSRSAGVKDLRFGYTIDEEWAGNDPDEVLVDARRDVPLVEGVGYYFLAATISHDPQHPLGKLFGDLLVRLPSATGEPPEPTRRIHFTGGAVLPDMHHGHIASHPDAYDVLREMLAP